MVKCTFLTLLSQNIPTHVPEHPRALFRDKTKSQLGGLLVVAVWKIQVSKH